MNTIHTIEDLIRLLDENPRWADAMRARLLTRELIEFPGKFTQFVSEVNSFTAEVRKFVEATNQRFDSLGQGLDQSHRDHQPAL